MFYMSIFTSFDAPIMHYILVKEVGQLKQVLSNIPFFIAHIPYKYYIRSCQFAVLLFSENIWGFPNSLTHH